MYAHNYSVFNILNNFKTAYRIKKYLLNRQRSVILRNVHDIGIADIPNVSLVEIKKTLKSHGYAVHDGYTSITTNCPICNCDNKTDTTKDSNKVFINKTTGYFVCPKCNLYGEWSILERYLRKKGADKHTKDYIQELRRKNEEFSKEWKRLVASTVSVESLNEQEVEYLFRLFDLPLYQDSPKVLKEVRVDSARTSLYFPLKNSAESVVGYNKLVAGSELQHISSGNHAAGLFSCKVQRCSREMQQCVLVPTVADVLALASHKVPGELSWWHSGTLPPSLLPLWENRGRVAVWGTGIARAVADKLGAERCCFVRTTEGPISALEAAAEGRNLRSMVLEAKSAAHRSITTFASLRDDILAELNNIEKVRGVKWRRFPALVRLLGGHRRGELTVLTGPTGSGKTTFCAEYSLDLAQQGVSTLWGSFEIKNSRLARTMLQQYAGVSLEENLQRFDEFADGFQRLPVYFLTFHGPQSIKVVMEAVEHATYVHDIAHVVVDNVQFMLGTGEVLDRFFKQDAVVAAFRTFATRRDVHVTLVMHPRKEKDVEDLSTSSIFGSAKASQEADNVLIIQDKRLTAMRGKKFLQVAKNRYSGDLGIVPLDFDKESLSYAQKKKILSRTVEPVKSSEVSDDGSVEAS